ncbi:MAG: MFS transporter [Proteobacteria bacterium]|nr:MFS transporter [Pseudomonadota bacterium]
MTDDTTNSGSAAIVFDDWRTISFAVFMALVGYSVMVTVPVLSTALVHSLSFTEEQVGRVWGNDMLGFSVGAIIAAFSVARVNRRLLVVGGIVLTIGANAFCMSVVDYEPMMWLRFAAGIGSGIFTGTAVTTLGGTTNPVRAFNILLLGFSFSAAGELHLFPQLSLNGIFWFLIGSAAICGLFLRWLPSRPLTNDEKQVQHELEDHSEDWRVPVILPIFCLIAVCFTYINIGGYFTYIELAALDAGVAQEVVTPLLTWASFWALAGCLLALLCARFGLFRPLFVALITMAVLVGMLSSGITTIKLAVGMFAFMALWTFVDVYQSSMMGYMDRSGSLVALLPAVQGFGQFVGPNIAASIIGAGLGYGTMFLVSGSMALVAMVIYGGIFLYMHKRKSSQVETVTEAA